MKAALSIVNNNPGCL